MMNVLLDTVRRLKDSGVESLEYFHCDHFEPWVENRGDGNYTPDYQFATAEQIRDKKLLIENFSEQAEKAWYSKKLTLFYLPALVPVFHRKDAKQSLCMNSDDRIGFVQYDTDVQQLMADAMGVLKKSNHEIQLHLHHESFTQSEQKQCADIREWLESQSNLDKDEKRFRLALEYTKKLIASDTGTVLEKWAFVHGKWALNASDESVCRITNELKILKEAGCFGDFTFPAGRKKTNPTNFSLPFSCIPEDGAKCYDSEMSSPLPITENSSKAEDRFFIWNSVLQHGGASLDYYSDVVKNHYANPYNVVLKWVTESPILNNKIYLKTHAHSLATQYRINSNKFTIPHQWSAIKQVFDILQNCLGSNDIAINCRCVSEVYGELMEAQEITQSFTSDDVKQEEFIFSGVGNTILNSEVQLKKEMDILWKTNNNLNRSRSLDMARYLESRYDTKNAIYLLGIGYYSGKGTSRNWNLALRYFSHSKLKENKTVAFFRARIILGSSPSKQQYTLAMSLLQVAIDNKIPQALEWISTSMAQQQLEQHRFSAPMPVSQEDNAAARKFVFIDAGAYMGQSTSKFVETDSYASCTWNMYAFEAHPELAQEISQRENLEIHNKAVWTQDGTIPFYGTTIRKNYLLDDTKPHSPGQGSSLVKRKLTGKLDLENPMEIRCVDIGKWIKDSFRESDFIILKMDVEGAEFEILDHMLNDGSMDFLNWIFVEFHAEKVGLPLQVETGIKKRIVEKGIHLVEDEDGQATGDWFAKSDRQIQLQISEKKVLDQSAA